MAQGGQPGWTRIGQVLLTAIFAILSLSGLVSVVADQLRPWQAARNLRSIKPSLGTIPAALPDTHVAVPSGNRVAPFGVSLQLPWDHTDATSVTGHLVTFDGAGGRVLLVDPAFNSGHRDEIHQLAETIPSLTANDLKSICSLQRAAMQTTTGQVEWWNTPDHNRRALKLLHLRLLGEPMVEGTLYQIENKGMCGFQQGDPQTKPYRVWIELFDPSDRHYKLMIASERNTALFTQSQINAIIASIQPASQPR